MLDRIPTPIRERIWRIKHACISMLARQGLAEYLQGLLDQQLRALRVGVILDVGANDGQYARMARRLGYRGRIISFEPIPENIELLEQQARKDGSWTVVPIALGDEESELPLNVMAQSEFSSFLSPSSFGKSAFANDIRVSRQEVVPVRRLDSMLPDLLAGTTQPNIHLKLDTQGFDRRVLRGCGSFLDQVCSLQLEVPLIGIYEAEEGGMETLSEVRDLGFFLTGFFPVSRERGLRVIEADCLFTRAPEGRDGSRSEPKVPAGKCAGEPRAS